MASTWCGESWVIIAAGNKMTGLRKPRVSGTSIRWESQTLTGFPMFN